ncbi:hypothetical protein PAEPH01_1909 [Pancytospora epiphaga]|nr:hypothetical protein PAEPH01_1909 [Pancytospora epiphaga]
MAVSIYFAIFLIVKNIRGDAANLSGESQASEKPVVKPGYSPSKYDPFATNYYKRNSQPGDYIKDHYAPSTVPKFGNISMLTLNAHVDKDTLEEEQRIMLLDLFNTHHPTVFAIQNISKKTLDFLIDNTKEHYNVANTTQKRVDITTKKEEYKPIFYDRYVLERVLEGEFDHKNKDQSYATFARLKMIRAKDSFLVINGDLLSSKTEANDAMALNILSNVRDSGDMSTEPFLYLGSIDTMSAKLKMYIESTEANTVEMDKNNKDLSINTFHNYGERNDGIQRDFVLLFDEKKKFKLDYARILSLYDTRYFMHYPVYSIFNKN